MALESDPGAAANPNEAAGYLVSGLLSGGVAAVTIARHEGWRKGITIGLLVFFGISSIKMFVDIWRRP